MSELAHQIEGKTLTVSPTGRIDISQAPVFERDMQALLAEVDCDTLVFDCTHLEFLSSAGIRVVLRLMRMVGNLRMTEVSKGVYEVLELTGLTEMIDVSQAMRRMTVTGCPVIGRGAKAVVYRIDPETVCKVYGDSVALDDISRERDLSRAAFVAGIPTAIPYDVVRVGERYGTVFELLDAAALGSLVASGAWSVERAAASSAALMRAVSEAEIYTRSLPSSRKVALSWVNDVTGLVSAEQQARLLELVEAIPGSSRLVHGDLHVNNIMVQDDEPLIIDMDTFSHGDPIFDLVATYDAYMGHFALDAPRAEAYLGLSRDVVTRLWELLLRDYLGDVSDDELRATEERIRLLSAVRLLGHSRRSGRTGTAYERHRLEVLGPVIDELLPRVSSLAL